LPMAEITSMIASNAERILALEEARRVACSCRLLIKRADPRLLAERIILPAKHHSAIARAGELRSVARYA
jgi:hypothetical protein